MQRPSVQSLPLRQLCKGRMTSINGVAHENSNTSLLVQQLQAALPPAAQAAAANSLNRWRRCAHRGEGNAGCWNASGGKGQSGSTQRGVLGKDCRGSVLMALHRTEIQPGLVAADSPCACVVPLFTGALATAARNRIVRTSRGQEASDEHPHGPPQSKTGRPSLMASGGGCGGGGCGPLSTCKGGARWLSFCMHAILQHLMDDVRNREAEETAPCRPRHTPSVWSPHTTADRSSFPPLQRV